MCGAERIPALALLLALCAALLPAAEKSRPEPALVRSLLFPGLGQFHEKKVLKGVLFCAAEAACIVLAVTANRRGNDHYRQYQAATLPEEAARLRRLTETYDRRRNTWMLVGAGVWALNLLDIHLTMKHKTDKGRPALSLSCHNGQIALACFVAW